MLVSLAFGVEFGVGLSGSFVGVNTAAPGDFIGPLRLFIFVISVRKNPSD